MTRHHPLVGLLGFLFLSSTAATALADNPIVQTLYTADPAPMVYDGRVYLYTGHDEDTLVNGFYTMNDWRLYSSADMVNWTDHGSPLSYTSFTWASGDAWAGQVVERNGTFYYYVPITQRNGGKVLGVATASSPLGPFTDALGHPLVSTSGCIDPTVFIDDDGQAYLYWGNPDLWYVKLNADMVSYQGSPTKVTLTTAGFGTRTGDPNRTTLYEEGPWFYKRGALYYMVYAAGGIPEYISYSTSSSPTGPWTYRGVIMPSQGKSFTNHPGVVDFQGNSYFFYHNGALPDGSGFHRSVAVEQFEYGNDGSFPTINMTSTGPAGVGHLDPYQRNEAETIAWGSGIETEPCSAGGMDVSFIENGDYIKVKGVDFGEGAVSFSASVASETTGGTLELRLDSESGALVGSCAVTGTGGWQTWTTTTCAVSGAAGIHDLFLRFTGGGGYLFNFDWWQFTSVNGGSAGAGNAGGAGTGAAGGGAAGSGGSAGTSGVAGTAGVAGSGVGGTSPGVAGTSSAGQSGAGAPAFGGSAGTSPAESSSSSSGCGCHVTPQGNSAAWWVGLMALGGLALRAAGRAKSASPRSRAEARR